MTADVVSPVVLEWAGRVAPGARVTGYTVRPLSGGGVSPRVDKLTLHLAGQQGPVELVRKEVPALEIAGLRAAQEVRSAATAIPELVAYGTDWLITPFAPGAPLAPGGGMPPNLIGTLATLHARYHGGTGLPLVIPRVTGQWWHDLCSGWAEPRLREHSGRHPSRTAARALALIGRAADLPAASAVLEELTPTLLHGDVHGGNVLVHQNRATLIDWGSCRVGPAALDLANMVAGDSAEITRYAGMWRQLTGEPLAAGTIALGYRWAALQLPVQYLPWTTEHRPTGDVEAALDRIKHALDHLLA